MLEDVLGVKNKSARLLPPRKNFIHKIKHKLAAALPLFRPSVLVLRLCALSLTYRTIKLAHRIIAKPIEFILTSDLAITKQTMHQAKALFFLLDKPSIENAPPALLNISSF